MADWICVFESSSMHEIAIKKAILSDEEIEAVILNQKDSMYQFSSVGSTIKLMVKPNFVIKAKHILQKNSTNE